jgi:uncharacterized protein (TIGR03437 family)
VNPPAPSGVIPTQAARLQKMEGFRVLLDGVPVAADRVGYAGLAPGWGGLYQVNLRLPENVGSNPEIKLVAGEGASQPALRIAVDATAH